MLIRITQLRGLGRFTTWETPKADELCFRRLTLVYARNAAGKSTIARMLASASSGDAGPLLLDQTLDTSRPPEVTLQLDAGTCRFDGTSWSELRPWVLVFNRDFLAQVLHDQGRHGDHGVGQQTVELELEPGAPGLRTWSTTEHQESEYLGRLRSIEAFVANSALDDQAAWIQGEIRKLLEDDVRHRRPRLFGSPSTPLEPVIRELQRDGSLRETTPWSMEDLQELDRLCAFGARGNHDSSHRGFDPPTPEAVRGYARRALDFVRR